MFRASEEAREWSAMLRQELLSWPGVRTRAMFGMLGFYRGSKIFACLPTTRTLGWSSNSFIFKFHQASSLLEKRISDDSNLRRSKAGALGWTAFDLNSGDQIPELLRWFQLAYARAK